MNTPIVGTEAIASGTVTRRELARRFVRLYPNVYLPAGLPITPSTRARAAWLWSSRRGILCGRSAAAIHDTHWLDPAAPAEMIWPTRHPPQDLIAVRDHLDNAEVMTLDGLPVTTPVRTAFDLGRRLPFTQALIHLDALAQATGFDPSDVTALADAHSGTRGLKQLRRLLPLVDGGAESPQETRTRLTLVRARLPQPTTQIRVRDRSGRVIARIDMGWQAWKVGVEFDGAQHWTDPGQRTRDIDRYAELEAEGWRLVRVSSDMLRHRATTVVSRVTEALLTAGWRPADNECPSTNAFREKDCA